MRKRLYDVVAVSKADDRLSRIYDWFMMICIMLSFIPLMVKEQSEITASIEKFAVCIFIIDYLLRWFTADIKLNRGIMSFVLYPFTPMAVVDLLSILPAVTVINSGFKTLRVLRLVSAMRVLRVFKIARYSENLQRISRVFIKQKDTLIMVAFVSMGYIFVSAIILFNVEPEAFESYLDALYWATILLTTVGYGDVCAVTATGKIVTMVSALIGIAIVALPAGILAAGYLEEVHEDTQEELDIYTCVEISKENPDKRNNTR